LYGKSPGRRRIPGILHRRIVVERDAPDYVLAELLALARIADIDIIQRGALRHTIIVQLDEAAELGRDLSGIIERQLIDGEIVVVAKSGRRTTGLRLHGVREGSLGGERERQPVIPCRHWRYSRAA